MWSVHVRTVLGRDRTNNYAEACHRQLQMCFNVHHPSIWHFISKLMRFQKDRDIDHAKFISGEADITKRNEYLKTDRKILSILERYDNNEMTILEALTGLSANYRMQ